MGPEAFADRGGQGALPGHLLCLPGRLARRAANPHQVYVYPSRRAALCFATGAYHAVEAAVEAADAKDPTLPHAPVEAADEAADAEAPTHA